MSASQSVSAETYAVKTSIIDDAVVVVFMAQMTDDVLFFITRYEEDNFEILYAHTLSDVS